MKHVPRLLSGFKAFHKRYFEVETNLYETLSKQGQNPHVLVIACSDSRIDPAILFDAAPGDLFTVRNVANLVPTYSPDEERHGTSSAIEYAVRDLGVSDILVLGHAHCGGIGAACGEATGTPLPKRDFLSAWLSIARSTINAELSDPDTATLPQRAEQASIRLSVRNLMTYPWVASRVERGEMRLHGWWFDIDAGTLWALDDAKTNFQEISGQ